MTDVYNQEVGRMLRERQPWKDGPRSNQMARGESSTSARGGSRFGVSGSSVVGTVTAITVATPFIVLFSPILLLVFVVTFLLATGYFTAREVGVAAKSGLSRMYEYVADSSRNKTREDSFDDRMTNKLKLKARETKDRDESRFEGGRFETGGRDDTNEDEGEGSTYNLVKAATAATTGTSLVAVSGLTFIGTVIALILATPPLVIFSPVLVPALITVFLLASGFVSSGGFGVAAATVFTWAYKYATEGQGRPTDTSTKFGSKGQESRYEDTRMFGLKPQESRNEETRGSKSKDQGETLDKEESRRPDSKLWETRDRDEGEFREGRYPSRNVYETPQNQGGNYRIAKAATATTVGGSLVVLSGLTFVGTVIGLSVATPLMVIFCPVLVPAIITVFLLTSGFFASGGFTVAAVTLGWLYKYVTKDQQNETNMFGRESRNQGLTGERSDFERDTGNVGKEGTQGEKTRDRGDFLKDIDSFEEGKQDAKSHGRRDIGAFEEGTQDSKTWDRRDFTRDIDVGEEGRQGFRYPYKTEAGTGYNQVVKAATATTAGGSFLVISGLTFVGTVIALILATPLLVLFSPVLVPALIALSLLTIGFVSSGGFGVTGTMVLAWLYRYVSSGQQTGEGDSGDSYDNTMNTMDLKGRERSYMTDQAIRTSHHATDQDTKYTSGAEKGDTRTMVKAATAATTGGSMLVFSGLTFAASVIALTVTTPLFVIFSPVLVPALITMFLLPMGFLTSGGFGVAGTTMLSSIYKFVTSGNRTREDSFDQGTHQTREDSFDQGTHKMGSKDWARRDIGDYGSGEGRHVTDRGRGGFAPASHHQA